MLINLRYRDWTVVRLQNASSVAYLNELFATGWYLMDLDLGELKCLAFSVPAAPPTRDERRMLVVRQSERTPNFVVVIVSRGRIVGRQQAVFYAEGEVWRTPDGGPWDRFALVPVEEGGAAVIYSRRGVGGETT
jgi:hypothetical protein